MKHLIVSLSVFVRLPMTAGEGPQTIGVANQHQLFVDHYPIDTLENARLILHSPHDEGPVLQFDKP